MPRILFVEHDGTPHVVDAVVGQSLMQAAIDNGVPGILADCGGCCSCGTCHGYVSSATLTAPAEDEAMMLEGVRHPRENSRLTCQIRVTEQMEGLRVDLPESQL